MILLHEQLSEYYGGLMYIRQLETQLQADWEQKLLEASTLAQQNHHQVLQDWELYEQARQANNEKRLRAWKKSEEAKEQRYRSKQELWQKRQDAIQYRHEARFAKWKETTIRPVRKAANYIWVGSLAAFMSGCSGWCMLFFLPRNWEGRSLSSLVLFLVFLAGIFLFLWGIYQEIKIRQLRRASPLRPPAAKPPQREPMTSKPKPDSPLPKPVFEEAPHLDLLERWLLAINRNAYELPEYIPETYGKPGEEDIFLLLAENLSDDYFAMRNLMLRSTLDVDLTLIGLTGIWLFDSKYWSGIIRYGPSGWVREKAFSMNDILRMDHEIPRDLGWENQKLFALQALKRSSPRFDWENVMKGGIAFTHPNCKLEISDACPIKINKSEGWLQTILASPEIPGFSIEVRLQAADALSSYSIKPRRDQVSGFQSTPSASLADLVYKEEVILARRYHEKYQRSPNQ